MNTQVRIGFLGIEIILLNKNFQHFISELPVIRISRRPILRIWNWKFHETETTALINASIKNPFIGRTCSSSTINRRRRRRTRRRISLNPPPKNLFLRLSKWIQHHSFRLSKTLLFTQIRRDNLGLRHTFTTLIVFIITIVINTTATNIWEMILSISWFQHIWM